MTLAEILTPERIVPDLRSDEQSSAIIDLVEHLVSTGDLTESDREPACQALLAREEQRSTAIGGGVAIPHSFLPTLDKVIAVFGRSKEGIDFCSLDRAPVHFIVLFLVPESEHGLHLKTLAAIAKTMNSAETRGQLAEATSANEILDVLANRRAAA